MSDRPHDFSAPWALATVAAGSAAVACVETQAGLFRLQPSLARAGLPGMDSTIALFADWPRARAALDACVATLDPADHVTGPRLVPVQPGDDWQDVGLKLAVNGQGKQDGRSSQMIFSIAEQIATASRIMTLDPGDLLLTGTPAGVGVPKGTFLSAGDRVDAQIAGIGRLSVTIQPPNA